MGMACKGEGELLKTKMGTDWVNLHPDIRARFDKNPDWDKPLYYQGMMTEMRCSRAGMVMAQLTRFSGALQPYRGKGVPVEIQVYGKRGMPHIFKQREYFFPGWKKPFRFTSSMSMGRKGELYEDVGFGLGMKLNVRAEDGNMRFDCDGYYMKVGHPRIGFWRLPLPKVLTPGDVILTHRTIDPKRFNITIDMKHPVFGQVFLHHGEFWEKENA